jgi:hypothetical protein
VLGLLLGWPEALPHLDVVTKKNGTVLKLVAEGDIKIDIKYEVDSYDVNL